MRDAPAPGAGIAPLAGVEAWLRDTAFPFWATVGVDAAGPGFVEHLTLAGLPADVPYKRVRVQARQVYCFCQAAERGWRSDALDIARRGVDLLIESAWQGPAEGWLGTLTRGGAPLDPTPDLYDIAFVLFGLGWWYRVTGDARVIPLACQTLDFLAERMRHPSGEGYLHRLHGEVPHRQNPHMHLTEAMIVLRDATGHPRFTAEADRLVALCLHRFYDAGSTTLCEDFDEAWGRGADPGGLMIEPGHHYEWVWLLHAYLGPARSDPAVEAAMRGLFGFAVRHGQSPRTGLVLDAVFPDGSVALPDHRLWPQAERLKAWLAMAERFGTDPTGPVHDGLARLFRHYLDARPAGTWIEHRTAHLAPRADKIPASSFYHVVLALAEVLRLRGLLGAGGTPA